MKTFVNGFVLVFGLSLYTQAVSASHNYRHPHWTAALAISFTMLAQASISAEEAAALVQGRTGGRVLAVKPMRVQGRAVYRVKVLTPKGEVRIYYVDAATGAM